MTARRLRIGVIVALVATALTLWLYVVMNVRAQTPPAPQSGTANETLQAQNQQLQRDMDRLVGLVGAGIGAVVTMAALLVAAQYLFSMRVYEHDKKILAEDLRQEVSEFVSERDEAIHADVADMVDRYRTEVAGDREDLVKAQGDIAILQHYRSYHEGLLHQLWSMAYEVAGVPQYAIRYEINLLKEALKSSPDLAAGLPGGPSSSGEQAINRIISLLQKIPKIEDWTRHEVREIIPLIPARLSEKIAEIETLIAEPIKEESAPIR